MRRGAVLVAALGLVAAACGGGDGDGDGGRDGAGGKEACPVDALDDATQPVEIVFWEQQAAANEDAIKLLAKRFNEEQDRVRVKLVNQNDYEQLFQKFKAGFETGDLPDVAIFEETTVQQLIDSQQTVPMQACVDAAKYDLSDFIPSAIDYYTVEDELRSMPWNVSNPVLFYNRAAFTKAGLDPDDPPRTLDEVKTAAEQIVASGATKHGMSLRIQDFYNEFWYAKAGQFYVNHDGGRKGRATKAELDNETGTELWTWWKDMVDSGLAVSTGSVEANIDHLLAIGTGDAAMTIDANTALGPVLDVLGTGQFPGVEIGLSELPGIKAGGGVPVGDGSLWISKESSPEKIAAAWEWTRWLVEPEQQAEWHLATGSIPIRTSVVELPEVQQRWKEQPAFRVGYDQLLAKGGPAANGSVIGNYQGVRDAVTEALTQMLTRGKSVEDALAQAQRDADAAIEEYNKRIGVG